MYKSNLEQVSNVFILNNQVIHSQIEILESQIQNSFYFADLKNCTENHVFKIYKNKFINVTDCFVLNNNTSEIMLERCFI